MDDGLMKWKVDMGWVVMGGWIDGWMDGWVVGG